MCIVQVKPPQPIPQPRPKPIPKPTPAPHPLPDPMPPGPYPLGAHGSERQDQPTGESAGFGTLRISEESDRERKSRKLGHH